MNNKLDLLNKQDIELLSSLIEQEIEYMEDKLPLSLDDDEPGFLNEEDNNRYWELNHIIDKLYVILSEEK